MSLNAQSTRPKPIGIPDQIESSLYSLVYIAVQYIPSTVSPGNIPYFIAAAFHESRTCPITGLQRPCPMKYFTISQGQFDVYPWTERLRYTKLQFLSGSEESGWTSHPIDFQGSNMCLRVLLERTPGTNSTSAALPSKLLWHLIAFSAALELPQTTVRIQFDIVDSLLTVNNSHR